MIPLKKSFAGFAGLGLCCLVFWASCATPPAAPLLAPPPAEAPRSDRFIDKLMALLNAGDIEGAIALFDTLSPEEAATAENRLLKASVLLSGRRLKESRALAEGLVAEDKNNIEARFVLSTVEGASGKAKERRAILEAIVKDAPLYVPALDALGQIYLNNKSLRNAGAYFDRALAVDANDFDALLGRANVCRLEYDDKKAEDFLNKAVEAYPARSQPYHERGRLYREEGRLKQALADLDMAKKLDPSDYWIAYDRGRTLLALNDKENALEEFDQAIKIEPGNFISYVYSAGIRDDLGDVDGAERDFIALARLRPDYYYALEGIGVEKMKKGDYLAAGKAFEEAYKTAPTENNYAILAAVNILKGGGKPFDIKPFVEQAMRKIDRNKLDYYVLRLFYDFSGDADVARRIDQEKNVRTKAQMLFYLAYYYDIRGNNMLADKFFIEFRDMGRMDLVEWRLNEWTLQQRNMQIGKTAEKTDDKG